MKFNGTMYKAPCALVIGCGDYPVFGKLLSVYVSNHKPLFYVQVLLSFVHIFVVTLWFIVAAKDLVSYLPLHMYTFPGRCNVCAIVPKHRLLTVE